MSDQCDLLMAEINYLYVFLMSMVAVMNKLLVCFFCVGASLTLFGQDAAQLDIKLEGNGSGMFLVEGCTDDLDSLVVTATEPSPLGYTLVITLGGSAVKDIDYILEVGDTLVIPPNETSVKIPIGAVTDNESEDRESLTITLADENTSNTFNLLILDALEVKIEPDDIEVCQGESVSLSTVLPGTYQWVVGNDTILTDVLSFVADEEQTIKALASYGNCMAEDEVDINLRTGIVFNEGDTAYVCLGETANITVDIIGNAVGDYVWSPMDSALTILDDQAIQVNTDVTRTYYLSFTNNVCSVTDSVVVRVDSIPELPITVVPEKESYCPGEIVTLFPRYLFPGDFPDIEYMWTFDAGTAIRGDSLKSFVLSTEDTSYFRLMTTNNACMRADSVLLNVINPPVELSLTDTTVCPNNPVRVELLNDEDFDEIMWSPEEGLSCTDCPDPTIQTATSMTYTMSGMSMGCPASGSVNVNIFPPDPITIIPDTAVCPGSPVLLSALQANEYSSLTWSGSVECTNCESPVAIADGQPVTVQGVKPDGCLGIGGTSIERFQIPSISVETDSLISSVEVGTPINLQASTIPDVSGTGSFTWMVNDMDIAATGTTITTPVVAEGDNVFKVSLTTADGCMTMATTTIEGIPPKYEIPSAFTPNGDELNNTFRVLIFGAIRLVDFKVFNRWGQLVYEGTDEQGWDGRHNGKQSPSDVYAYMATLERLDGSIEVRRGEVALIR
ncbi:MAG: T9SS type B sorting domain-containing protein [Saprospiraceae bacterium]|nr:T9SS type B sorting domain-containing protein [Saprospiraceae bacterium]